MNVEELSARAEIHDVLLRYCRGLDRVDMKLVRGAFHDDAWIDFPASLHVGTLTASSNSFRRRCRVSFAQCISSATVSSSSTARTSPT